MGIIQKQSINSSIFIFIGFAIGAFNIMVLFPKFLTQNELGLTRAMIDISLILSALCTLGSLPVIYKFYPFYNDYLKGKKNDLPFITAIVCLTGFIIIVLSGIFFEDFIVRKLGKSPQFAAFFYTVYPYTFFLLMFSWLEAFGWSAQKTVITNFLKETSVRIFNTVLILLYGFHVISIVTFINIFSFSFAIPALILLWVLIKSGKWRFSITQVSSVTKRLKGRMISFGLFVFSGHFLSVLARTNDTILIIGLRGLAETSVFTIATYMIAVMEIPQRSMNAISVPVLAEAWKNKDLQKIKSIYTKSVANLLVIGLGIFGLIFLNSHNVTKFLGREYAQIELIVFVMGFAKVLDLGTGINSQIIGTSNFWRFDFYTSIVFTLFSIPLNFFLIKYFGLKGAAFSSLVSLTVYNSIRFAFLYRKFNLQPYTIKSLLSLVIAAVTYLLVYSIPRFDNLFADIFVRTSVFVFVFLPLVFVCKITPDLNKVVIDRTKTLLEKTGLRK